MKRRGQFYLITVIVLISMFIAFASIYNFVRVEKGIGIYEIKAELEIEIEKTMEYIAYKKLSDSVAKEKLSELTDIYVNRLGENKNSFFIYGTQSSLSLKGFKATEENILIKTNSEYEPYNPNAGLFWENYTTITEFGIKMGDVEKLFEIKQGQSFYYLIHYKEAGGEYIVIHN